ncbi:hypothetical protein GCM10010406_11810 [Streptomyces thermolineatus]|uniref:Class F sortase n=1 Tax=Streptomyces thermolineatus TaxID=44033 RepID=A0ABP5YGF8_9ACTN
MHGKGPWWILLTVCTTVLLATVATALVPQAPPAEFGSRPAAPAPAAPSAAGAPSPAPPSPSPGAGAGARAEPVAEPVRLGIPAVGLDARVVPVGVATDGTVQVPPDAQEAGWYRHGPAPGSPGGSAVLVGHVDSRTGDLGALAALYRVREGDEVTVGRSGAAPVRYRVTARTLYDKERLPAGEVFRRTGDPVLTLVTCAAPYDRDRGGYLRNLVVSAVPVSG